MLKTELLHPQMLSALAAAGHGSLVLIADGNYPVSTTRGENAALVHLNLRAGTIDAVTILETVAGAIPVEEAFVMAPLTEGPYALAEDPALWSRFSEVLARSGAAATLQRVERMAFYAMVANKDVALVVASGETAPYGNLLLRIGVVGAGHDNVQSSISVTRGAKGGAD